MNRKWYDYNRTNMIIKMPIIATRYLYKHKPNPLVIGMPVKIL